MKVLFMIFKVSSIVLILLGLALVIQLSIRSVQGVIGFESMANSSLSTILYVLLLGRVLYKTMKFFKNSPSQDDEVLVDKDLISAVDLEKYKYGILEVVLFLVSLLILVGSFSGIFLFSQMNIADNIVTLMVVFSVILLFLSLIVVVFSGVLIFKRPKSDFSR